MALLPYNRIVIEVVSLLFCRSLRCTRIMLHINLFVSFAVNNALWILWYRLVVEQPSVLSDNEVGALILTLLPAKTLHTIALHTHNDAGAPTLSLSPYVSSLSLSRPSAQTHTQLLNETLTFCKWKKVFTTAVNYRCESARERERTSHRKREREESCVISLMRASSQAK